MTIEYKFRKLNNLEHRRLEFDISRAYSNENGIEFDDLVKIVNCVCPGSKAIVDGNEIALGKAEDDCWNQISMFDAAIEAIKEFCSSAEKKSKPLSRSKKTSKQKVSK